MTPGEAVAVSQREPQAGGLIRSWPQAPACRGREVMQRPKASERRPMADTIPLSDLGRHIGEEIGVSSWITLDQTRISEFAHCTGDHQWIHVDPERAARESRFGGTIAHGFLTLALIAPTTFEVMATLIAPKSVVNYGLGKVRFHAPVRSV